MTDIIVRNLFTHQIWCSFLWAEVGPCCSLYNTEEIMFHIVSPERKFNMDD